MRSVHTHSFLVQTRKIPAVSNTKKMRCTCGVGLTASARRTTVVEPIDDQLRRTVALPIPRTGAAGLLYLPFPIPPLCCSAPPASTSSLPTMDSPPPASGASPPPSGDVYLHYSTTHSGRYGRESLTIQVSPTGRLSYNNSSGYKRGTPIRKEVTLSPAVLVELHRLLAESGVMDLSDEAWPPPSGVGTAALEVVLDGGAGGRVKLRTATIGSLLDVVASTDADGLRVFYYVVQDVRCLIFALLGMHYKIKPI